MPWDFLSACQDTLLPETGIIKAYQCGGVLTCQAVRQDVHIRCLQGSIFTSLSFSAQILQSWNVEPISQYSSYCSCTREDEEETGGVSKLFQEGFTIREHDSGAQHATQRTSAPCVTSLFTFGTRVAHTRQANDSKPE